MSNQNNLRDKTVDWILASKCYHAVAQNIWDDFSPTSNWKDAGPLIEKYQIDIRYFSKDLHPDLEHEWMGGVMYKIKNTNLTKYFTSFGPTPLLASMTALSNALSQEIT